MANNVYELQSIGQGIKWMHAVYGYLVKSTWMKAIRAGNFVGWPLLTVENVHKHYPETEETPKVHLNQSRHRVRSTKYKATPLPTIEVTDSEKLRGKKERYLYTKVYEAKLTIYSDQTGRFPYYSKRGYKYIMVMVDNDSKVVMVAPLKNKTDGEMRRTYLF